jgi:hypothetical protein
MRNPVPKILLKTAFSGLTLVITMSASSPKAMSSLAVTSTVSANAGSDSLNQVDAPISMWGEIPVPSDSSQTTFKNRSRSAWEWPLYVPYAAINYPLRWIREGFGKGVVWADKRDLFSYISIVPVPKGVVPSFDYSGQEGFGVGLNVYYQIASPDNPVRLRGKYSTERWQKYSLGTILNKGGKWELHLGGGYKLMPNLEYYGIGPNTSVDNAVFYKDERAWGGANARRRVSNQSFVSLIGVYSTVAAREPDERYHPTMTEKYGSDVPPGFRERSNGVMMRLSWVLNTSEKLGNPEHGTMLGVSVGGFVGTNTTEISFTAYRFELQQFVPLWYSQRALALRGYLNFVDNTGTAEIPFQRMFINETPDMFRAFDSGRWRDLGITGIDIEYRFPFTADGSREGFGIDTVLLTDIGQVFSERSEIKIDNLTYSYGIGIRAFLGEFFVGSVEFVWGDEGFQFRIGTKQLYQYSKDVLLQGREETLIH